MLQYTLMPSISSSLWLLGPLVCSLSLLPDEPLVSCMMSGSTSSCRQSVFHMLSFSVSTLMTVVPPLFCHSRNQNIDETFHKRNFELCAVSVSYTHLDVYKRQLHNSAYAQAQTTMHATQHKSATYQNEHCCEALKYQSYEIFQTSLRCV